MRARPFAPLGLALCAFALSSGCATPRPSTPDATAALIARRDFPAAAQAAPQWVDAALRTITAYEAQLGARLSRP